MQLQDLVDQLGLLLLLLDPPFVCQPRHPNQSTLLTLGYDLYEFQLVETLSRDHFTRLAPEHNLGL